MNRLQNITLSIFLGLLAGCTLSIPPAQVSAVYPAQWFAPLPSQVSTAPLPHQGSLAGLAQWWQQQGDPLLVELIAAGQAVSPSIASARSRIEQARATRVGAGAVLAPRLDGNASVSRSQSAPVAGFASTASTLGQGGLQTSWEIDLLGGNRAARNASEERLQGAQAQWHDARVLVAAEVARQYYALRSCEKLVRVTQLDAGSRSETARLSALATQAGFEAPATAALARASAAESRALATQQKALCEIDVKVLVALTAFDEPLLRRRLGQTAYGSSAMFETTGLPGNSAAPNATGIPGLSDSTSHSARLQGITGIPSVPAELLAQRPDVFNAARELAAASFDVGSADAARFPRLSLSGAITTGRVSAGPVSQGFDTWSFGPLALTVPLFDGGAAKANLTAAQARYEDAASRYRSIARQAVREVEEALVNLQSTADRTGDSIRAAEGYNAFFKGTEARYKAGLASLVELEDARRTLLAAQSAVVKLELERSNAWVALYRALGGGWSRDTPGLEPLALGAAKLSPTPAQATPSAVAIR